MAGYELWTLEQAVDRLADQIGAMEDEGGTERRSYQDRLAEAHTLVDRYLAQPGTADGGPHDGWRLDQDDLDAIGEQLGSIDQHGGADAAAAGHDGDGWFSGGYDDAHTAYLAALAHTDDVELSAREPEERVARTGMPASMVDGIAQRATTPGRPDDPAELAARLADLQSRIAARTEPAAGPVGGWETVGREEAAHRLADRGVDLTTARGMVTDYLRQTSEQLGVPVYQWGLDQGDVEAIAADHRVPPAHDAEVTDDQGHGDDDAAGWSR